LVAFIGVLPELKAGRRNTQARLRLCYPVAFAARKV
jgi:hypothetical protein